MIIKQLASRGWMLMLLCLLCSTLYSQPCTDANATLDISNIQQLSDCRWGFWTTHTVPNGWDVVNYEWDYDDMTTSGPITATGVTHIFPGPGSYSVCVTMFIQNTATGETCSVETCTLVLAPDCVGNCNDCTVNLPPPSVCDVDDCTKGFFIGEPQLPGACSFVSYTWDFGEGPTETTTAPGAYHTYTSSGTFDVCVTLNATNGAGQVCTSQICIQVVVTGCGTPPDPCVDCNASVGIPSMTSFTNCLKGFSTVAASNCSLIDFTWEMGDGTVLPNQPAFVQYEYTSSGTFDVCAIARFEAADGSICEARSCTTIVISGCTLCSSDQFEPNNSTGQAVPNPAGSGEFYYTELCLTPGDMDFFMGGNGAYLIQVFPGGTNTFGKYNLLFDPKVNTDCITVRSSPFANSQTDTRIRLFDNSSIQLPLLAQDDNSGQGLFSLIEFDCGPMIGEKMQGLQKISVYPNPVGSGERLQLNLPDHVNTLEFLDLQGKVVWSQEVNPQQSVQIPSELSEGVYLINSSARDMQPIRLSVQNR